MAENPPLFSAMDSMHSLDELFERSREYRDSQGYIQTLRFIARFRHYSPYNGFLIRMQDPTATYVASTFKWQREFGRWVLPQARPLVILVPFGPVGFVYDLRETEGPPVPVDALEPFPVSGQLPPRAWENLLAHCQESSIEVRFIGAPLTEAGRIYSASPRLLEQTPIRMRRVLEVNRVHSPEVQFITLVHELAHLLLGHLGKQKEDKWKDPTGLPHAVVEIEAESVAFLVGQHLGLRAESEKYLADFVSRYGQDLPPIGFHEVLSVAGKLLEWAKKPPKAKREAESSTRKTAAP